MGLDYEAIGRRIRNVRLEKRYTQDRVAEITTLSNPHISNIERGTTKLSLPTIVSIANALEVTVDEFLCDNVKSSQPILCTEITELLLDCTIEETRIIAEVARVVKESLRNVYGMGR